MDYLGVIRSELVDFKADSIGTTVRGAIQHGVPPLEVVDALWEGMKEVGQRYETGEFFFAELTMAGKTMKEAMEVLLPILRTGQGKGQGHRSVVIGTVKGDLHDIGKDLVVGLLEGAGIGVVDLGVDVPKEEFVRAVEREGATVVGLSALLSTTITYAKDVVDAFVEAGLRDRVKVIVGGAAATEDLVKGMGADASATDAFSGVGIIKEWLGPDPG